MALLVEKEFSAVEMRLRYAREMESRVVVTRRIVMIFHPLIMLPRAVRRECSFN
jgi:hypothetical protein